MSIRTRYIAIETLISIAINGVLSAAFFIALFRGRPTLAWWTSERLANDFLPQSFMVALMGSFIPMLITRSRLKFGKIADLTVRSIPSIQFIATLALAIAVFSVILFGGTAIGIVWTTKAETIDWAHALTMKVAFGMLVAVCVTPCALLAILKGGAKPRELV